VNEQSAQLEKQILGMVGLNLSLREMGRRVGKSYERVRQIMARHGLSGTQAQQQHRADVAELRCLDHPLFGRFTKELFKRGLEWEYVMDQPGYNLLTVLRVGGMVVQLRVASIDLLGHVRLSGRRKNQSDIFACYIPKCGWLIFPNAAMPLKSTIFALEPRKSGRTHARHDYRHYLNKWEIFTEAQS
jgi:hypothetical protein